MSTNRFQVTRVSENLQEKPSAHPSELIPLIHIEKDVPSPPPLPPSFIFVDETTTRPSSSRLFNSLIQRLKPHGSTNEILSRNETNNSTNEIDKPDSYYSTIQSNAFDTISSTVTNKFLHELRSKRREIRAKANDVSIDQRIAMNRQQNDQQILRAQDIFAVHFELNDSENLANMVFNEDAQEKIRNNIFDELDRQRMKQFHKQHRQLVFGRALLMFITSILIFMGVTLVYVVIDLYDRATNFESKLPDNEFISMIYDQTSDTDS